MRSSGAIHSNAPGCTRHLISPSHARERTHAPDAHVHFINSCWFIFSYRSMLFGKQRKSPTFIVYRLIYYNFLIYSLNCSPRQTLCLSNSQWVKKLGHSYICLFAFEFGFAASSEVSKTNLPENITREELASSGARKLRLDMGLWA